jgi:drug/metabolite transporter (DMT)-like permease
VSPQQVFLALSCVAAISVGQLLFKVLGNQLATGQGWTLRTALAAAAALALYAAATIGWVLLLRSVALTKAYPYMALSFVLVPLLGVALLAERPAPSYALGVILIVAGIVIAARAG